MSRLGSVELWKNRKIKYPYKQTSSTIAHILQKHEYSGHTENFRTSKHFKDKKSHYADNRYTMRYNQYEGEPEQLQSGSDGYKTEQAQYENDNKSAA